MERSKDIETEGKREITEKETHRQTPIEQRSPENRPEGEQEIEWSLRSHGRNKKINTCRFLNHRREGI